MQSNITKAVLLAAGRGTRMRELTQELPKPMLEVRGKPVLQHIVEGLRDAASRISCHRWMARRGRSRFLPGRFQAGRAHGIRHSGGPGWHRKSGRTRTRLCWGDPFLLSYGDILVAPENYPRICDTLGWSRSCRERKAKRRCEPGRSGFCE